MSRSEESDRSGAPARRAPGSRRASRGVAGLAAGLLAAFLAFPTAARPPPASADALGPAEQAALRASPAVPADLAAAAAAGAPLRVVVSLHAVPDAPASPPAARARRARRVEAVLETLVPGDLALRHRYRALDGFAGEIRPGGLARLAADPRVRAIALDRGGRGHLAESLDVAGFAPPGGIGPDGTGVTVAFVDSGIDLSHADLAGAVVAERCFCSGGGGCCPNGLATQSGAGAAQDDHGHGTNVAGIVTSDGVVAPRGGAAGAEVVAVKVLDANNAFCCSSDVVAALDWILDERPDVDVVNLSLGTFALYAGVCDTADAVTQLFADAVDALRARGTPSVAAAMNGGSTARMAAPACVENALSVGAVWDADVGSQTAFGCTDPLTAADLVTCWSNRNATTDLFAPGAPVTSAGLGGGVSTFRGTSQAAPLVSACLAALFEADPLATADHVEKALRLGAVFVPDAAVQDSVRRLDCASALAALPEARIPLAPLWGYGAGALALLLAARRRRRARCRGAGRG